MPKLKFDFSRHIYLPPASLGRALPLSGAAPPCGLTYLIKPALGDITFITRTSH